MPSAVPIFAALGDFCRLSIMERLCAGGPLPTSELNVGGGVSRQGLTKHLRILEGAGLLDSFRVGRDRQWQVRPEQLTTVRTYLDRIAAEWDARLDRLRTFVEASVEDATDNLPE